MNLAVINGLRGWAIAGVVFHHAFAVILLLSGTASRRAGAYWFSPYALVTHGWLGVNLFFVLSGFVLMLPYAGGVRSLTSWKDAGAFYRRRALRLFPLYYLVITIAMYTRPLQKLSSWDFLRDAAEYLTFTFVFEERLFFTWYNPVLWSLAVEVWFSLVFPALVVAWKRFGMVALLAVVVPVSFAVRLYGASRYPDASASLNYIKDNLPGRLDDFVVGMALAVWSIRKPTPAVGKTVAGFVAGFVLLTACANGWDNVAHRTLGYGVAAVLNDVALVGFAALVAGLLACPSKWLALPFTFPPIQLLGMMSYSIYVWHVMGGHAPYFGPEDFVVFFALVLGLAALTYRFVEFPKKTFSELFLRYPPLRID